MQFKLLSAASILAVASAASSVAPVSAIVETVTEKNTIVATITKCENDACSTGVVPATESVVTTTVNGEVTLFTTICPLTETTLETPVVKPVVSSEAPVEEPLATDATVVVVPTSAPETIAAVPVESADVAPTSAPEIIAAVPVESVAAGSDTEEYVDVTITPTVTATTVVPKVIQTSQSTYYNTISPQVSAWEGSANKQVVGAMGLVGLVAILL